VNGDFHIGAWLVQPSLDTVSCNGSRRHLEPKVMEVLVCLAKHSCETVSKEQLIRTVWGDTFVTDDVLTRCISELRKALDDDPKEPHIIETIPKRGYRLLSQVEQKPTTSGLAGRNRSLWPMVGGGLIVVALIVGMVLWRTYRHPGGRQRAATETLAVLPLQNLNHDPALDYLRFAIPDEIITAASYTPSVRVRPLAMTSKYEAPSDVGAVGRELGASHLISGRYLSVPDGLQVTLEVFAVDDGKLLFRQSQVVPANDFLEMRRRLLLLIRRGVMPVLNAVSDEKAETDPPRNQEAYSLYLRSMGGLVNNQQSIAMLEKAVALDSKYAPPWARLGQRYYGRYEETLSEADFDNSTKAYQRALQEHPGLFEAVSGLVVNLVEKGELESAYDQVRELVARHPGSPDAHLVLAYVFRYAGLWEEAGRECDMARDLDPAFRHNRCSLVFLAKGQYERALEYAPPDDSLHNHTRVTREVLLREHKLREALQLGEGPASDPWVHAWFERFMRPCLEGKPVEATAAFAADWRAEAMRRHDSEPKYWVASHLAFCGHRAKAMELLRAAVAGRYCAYPAPDRDPMFASLRGDPAYQTIRSDAIACQQKFLEHRAASVSKQQ